uniref:Membrane protein n=1 Tax=Babesia bovis TaxID=5865 RepID=S6B8R9_BABBO|nr:membrane protein [Babesia bovis]
MDNTTYATIVLVLLWLYLCCQALGLLVPLIDAGNATAVPTTITLSTVVLGICLWQCKKAGYLVSPMTRYHWMLLILLVVLQLMTVVLERQGWGLFNSLFITTTYPIYGIVVVLLGILGGTLYCGWKCNLFCRPCCKSQYICYGSVVVVVLVVITVLILVAVVEVAIVMQSANSTKPICGFNVREYTLLGYSTVLMVPTLWYAYRCGLLTWCLPKKRSLKATDTAENTTIDTDIAKES